MVGSIIRADPGVLERLLRDPRCDIHSVASWCAVIQEAIYHCRSVDNVNNVLSTISLMVDSGVKVEEADLIFSQNRFGFELVSNYLALQISLQGE